MIGLTMIKVRDGHERSAYEELRRRPEIKEVYRLFGEFDLFLIIQGEGRDELERTLEEIWESVGAEKTGPVLFTQERAAELGISMPASGITAQASP